MIDLPIGKALITVKSREGCSGCFFVSPGENSCPSNVDKMCCAPEYRKDGKNVIFKLVDLQRIARAYYKAGKLGVLAVDFISGNGDFLDSLEATLDIIEKDKKLLDRNAGEDL